MNRFGEFLINFVDVFEVSEFQKHVGFVENDAADAMQVEAIGIAQDLL